MTDLISEARAAEMLGISRSTLREWRTTGRRHDWIFPFRPVRVPGGTQIRYMADDVREWAKNNVEAIDA